MSKHPFTFTVPWVGIHVRIRFDGSLHHLQLSEDTLSWITLFSWDASSDAVPAVTSGALAADPQIRAQAWRHATAQCRGLLADLLSLPADIPHHEIQCVLDETAGDGRSETEDFPRRTRS